jgi:hypothetical protein
MLLFSKDKCGKDGISVHFYQQKRIIVTNTGKKSEFISSPEIKDLNGTDFTFHLVDIWFVYQDSISFQPSLTNRHVENRQGT